MEDLAKKLGYNKDAQVMAVKSVLPRDVYGICMTYKKLKDLKAFLIELFSNPKMREAVPGSASIASDPSVFSIGQHMENNVVNPTATDVGKIPQDMNAMQVKFNKMSSADFRSNSSNKPWKPEVTSPRRRGGSNRGRQFDNMWQNDSLQTVIAMVASMGVMAKEMGMALLEIEGKAEEILEVHSMVKVEDKVYLTKVQMSDAQE